jgi:hypothetical protein
MQLRLIFSAGLLLFGVGRLSAESHPAWWRYASPEARALVGIQWEHVRSSHFADAIAGELTGEGGLGFPDIECLKESRQILISSPALLAIASGNFPAATVRDQAGRKGWKRAPYKDFEIWVTPGKETLSLARMTDQLMLVGRVKTLQDAIDRSLLEGTEQAYSPLLARAARYAQDDLWVVANRLPDPLVEHFVPIDAQAEGFEGGVSLQGGVRMGAAFSVESEEAAGQLAEALKQSIAMLPPMARGIQVNIVQNNVILGMAISEEQLVAGLRTTTVAAAATKPEAVTAKPTGPQVIRIFGLDEGPREIVLR